MNDQEKFWLGNFGNNYTKRSFNQKTILNKLKEFGNLRAGSH